MRSVKLSETRWQAQLTRGLKNEQCLHMSMYLIFRRRNHLLHSHNHELNMYLHQVMRSRVMSR